MPLNPSYDTSVFINCPFDDQYTPIFNAMIFVILECGFTPRCALEINNSGQIRLDKIMAIIADCRLAIHDISSTQLDTTNNLPRFNMPFELGLFLGAGQYGDADQQRKQCLILDKDKYRYQKFLSDIAGQDISAHNDKLRTAIEKVRDFLANFAPPPRLPGAQHLETRFNTFMTDFPVLCGTVKLVPAEAKYADFVYLIKAWHAANPTA